MQKPSAPRRVLIIQLQHHGDVLLTTPMFSALKEQFPGVEVDVLVFAETAPMIKAHPDLSHIWHLPRSKEAGRGLARLMANLKLLKRIYQRRYDWVLHLNERWPGAWAALASRAPVRVSYSYPKRDNPVWRLAFPIRLPIPDKGHRITQNLSQLEALGVRVLPAAVRCQMAFTQADQALAMRKLQDAGVGDDYILVHPGSRWFYKCWEDERFAEVVAHLANQGHKIVLTAAPDERELAMVKNIMQLANHTNITSLAGQLTLPALAAAIAKAKLFIGVDSVPMHMAAALQTPTVALFGPTIIETWRPWSDKAIIVSAADYGSLIAPWKVDATTNERYLKNISIQSVLEKTRKILTDTHGKN